ncbi:MAG: hypothetical protein LBC75_03670 [Fibromonadaceae bacterium]|jgi:hypothetical protein|nr:hypothetical protein [Fibromonadaceae bacterium]
MPLTLNKPTYVSYEDLTVKKETDFTAWLADNIDFLSDKLGLPLVKAETEVGLKASQRRIDILAENTGKRVVIEAQWKELDPEHIGRGLLYMSNQQADILIFIASEIEEFKDTINMLNEHGMNIYALEISFRRINPNQAEPEFDIVCQPNVEFDESSEKPKSQQIKDVEYFKKTVSNKQLPLFEKILSHIKSLGDVTEHPSKMIMRFKKNDNDFCSLNYWDTDGGQYIICFKADMSNFQSKTKLKYRFIPPSYCEVRYLGTDSWMCNCKSEEQFNEIKDFINQAYQKA